MDIRYIDVETLLKLSGKLDTTIELLSNFRVNPKTSQSISEDWLDNQDVCLMLKISKRKLQRLRDTNEIKFHRVGEGGRKILYKFSDVEQLITKG